MANNTTKYLIIKQSEIPAWGYVDHFRNISPWLW